ncbi:hypothetical protein SLEP1_g33935 [Rubroshorea leprosula]|uniref:Uncharacterized protein n=1 Tax=Rubroshorea leprosula TaxID=152421 RepID=A0AAV5KIB2_9ROSI|nr:hypothetical protein SLEP1_g33935 [Rubroshorea leprosula]
MRPLRNLLKALKHKIQDLIDKGKLQLNAKETKGAPNITQNPLPLHDVGTMNMVTFDEVEKSVLENASAWSLDELFAILGHALQDCGDFQDKIKELQGMGALRFVSAQEPKKFIAPVTEEYFTKEKPYILQDTKKAQVISQNFQQPYVLKTSLSGSPMGKISSMANCHFSYSFKFMPQRSVILNSTANDVSNMTHCGWCSANLEVKELRKAILKSKDIIIEEMLEESPKKPMSEKEVTEFLNILRKKVWDYGWGNLGSKLYINFTDDEIPDEGNGHTKALHIFVQCKMMNVPHVLIDNGSALNVIPLTVLEQLKVDDFHINQCSMMVCAFDGTKRNVVRKIELLVEIGPLTFDVDFFVMDISPTFNKLLGRPWIHIAEALPSTLHQKVKYIVNGLLVIVNGEEKHVIRPQPFITWEWTLELMNPLITRWRVLLLLTYIQGSKEKRLKWLNLLKSLLGSCFRVNINWERVCD